MRSDEDVRHELRGAREPAGDGRTPRPDGEPHAWEHGPQTAAERVAARRWLDRLAEEQ
jgi:hypothetical protein